MTKLTISAKGLEDNINYIPFSNSHNFLVKKENKEVVSKNLTEIKRFNKVGLFASTLGVGITIPSLVSASTTTNQIQNMVTAQEIFEFGEVIAFIGLGVSVSSASCLLIFTSILKMLNKNKEAKAWNTQIIKGLIQSLVAIPLVFAIYRISTAFFQELGVLNFFL
ncbi:hypothetical protein [Virgibacillus sp. DJP39]|uniref:hypothetical protein n=1 Tax=Virgibacillus sp. DJP39 TaxID=3409790 RepID=UPI003BB546A6